MLQKSQYIYIRQSTGLCYQYPYNSADKISQILVFIFKKQLPPKLRAFNKARLLQINQSLLSNNIKPNEIIHLHSLSRPNQINGFLYLSYLDKVFRIPFQANQNVRTFKNKVQQETGLDFESQIILYNSIQLENSKFMKDYEIRSDDYLCMAKFIEIRPHVLDLPQIIFPKKNTIQKRRSSECMHSNQIPYHKIVAKNEGKSLEATQKLVQSQPKTPSDNTIFGPSSKSDLACSLKIYDNKKFPDIISQQFIQQLKQAQQSQRFSHLISSNSISSQFPNNKISRICNKQLELSDSQNYKDGILLIRNKSNEQNLYLSQKITQQNVMKLNNFVSNLALSTQIINTQ